MKPTPTPTQEMIKAAMKVRYGADVYDLWRDEALADFEKHVARILSAALSVPAAAVVGEPVAWTGSGSMMAIADGREGFIWPTKADAHPIPLYAAPSAPEGWQPIETAPDEGVFLVWCGFVCFGYIGYHHGEKRWYDSDALEGGNYIRVRPTHWRPLPAPPALGGAK